MAGGFLQIVPLIVYYVKLYLLGSTPRSVWGIKYGKISVAWGTVFPGITLLVVIGTSTFLILLDFQLNKLNYIVSFGAILQPLATLSSHLSSTDSPVPLSSCSINSTNIFSYMYTNNLLQRIREDCFTLRRSNMFLWGYMYNRFVCVLYFFWRRIAMVIIDRFLREPLWWC